MRNGIFATIVSLAIASLGCSATLKVAELVATGDARKLRDRPKDAPTSSPEHPPIFFLGIDGVDRNLLYPMLENGELPAMARMLGGKDGGFPHAYFEHDILSVLPSSTMVAWTTALTGANPAEHGVAGNELFIRETRTFAAPVPVTFEDPKPVIDSYVDDYVDRLLQRPTVYTRMRERDPNVLAWVAMQQIHGGADLLLRTDRYVLRDAFQSFIEDALARKHTRALYEKIDDEAVDGVLSALKKREAPDVLTLYLSGADQYAHVAEEGPDAARRAYLIEVVDPLLAKIERALAEKDVLADRYVVITADHGHTEVVRDDAHALSMSGPDDPPALIAKAGFRLRPFHLEVDPNADFDTVVAYQGAMAYLYVADRSTCPAKGARCDWEKPPRYVEDVIPLADAFWRNDRDGSLVPELRGTLDMILVRRPRPWSEVDAPFEVYVGDGRTEPVESYLQEHPHPTYVAVDERLRDLAVGPHGERAGDVLLIAHNGDREKPQERYYFAGRYRSWHGSPSKQDSEIPLIVASPQRTKTDLQALTRGATGPNPRQKHVAEVLLAIRALPRTR